MFVQTNTIRASKNYMQDRLRSMFSESEIRQIVRESICKRMQLSHTDYLLSDDLLLSESDLLFLRSVVKRLLANEPFQYIIGSAHFCNLELKTDARALIPRPETEELVFWLSEFYATQESINVLDICSGSGCIALALKDAHPGWEVNGLDVSKGAIELSKENAHQLGLKVNFIEGDALGETIRELVEPNSLDCIVSNPPYIPNEERKCMNQNVLDYEPDLALFVSDEDPLIFYRSIAQLSTTILKSGGTLFFELHENFAQETVELMQTLGFVNIELRKDLQGKNRMLLLQKP
jgi:release factor glutamine methyltransferase